MNKFMVTLGVAACLFGANANAASKVLAFNVDNKPALTMQLPDDWTSKGDATKTDIHAGKHEVHIQLWRVANVKSVQDAIPMVADLIKSEVTEFKAHETKSITVAGSAAKHIIGTGSEADDGDPSNAEVYLFSSGGNVFLMCAHGEGTGASKVRSSLVKVLATAKKP